MTAKGFLCILVGYITCAFFFLVTPYWLYVNGYERLLPFLINLPPTPFQLTKTYKMCLFVTSVCYVFDRLWNGSDEHNERNICQKSWHFDYLSITPHQCVQYWMPLNPVQFSRDQSNHIGFRSDFVAKLTCRALWGYDTQHACGTMAVFIKTSSAMSFLFSLEVWCGSIKYFKRKTAKYTACHFLLPEGGAMTKIQYWHINVFTLGCVLLVSIGIAI